MSLGGHRDLFTANLLTENNGLTPDFRQTFEARFGKPKKVSDFASVSLTSLVPGDFKTDRTQFVQKSNDSALK